MLARVPVPIADLPVQCFKFIRNASLTSSFACCSLWPVSLPRWAQIEVQGKANADGKTHPSLELLAGNREFGYRGRVESIECFRPESTDVVYTGPIHFLPNFLQGEPPTTCSRDRHSKLRFV